jgi:hypothetical protein
MESPHHGVIYWTQRFEQRKAVQLEKQRNLVDVLKRWNRYGRVYTSLRISRQKIHVNFLKKNPGNSFARRKIILETDLPHFFQDI